MVAIARLVLCFGVAGVGWTLMTLPSSQRVAVLHSPGDLRLEERPVPRPGRREVLVKIRSVGVCGSDVHYFRHGRIGHFVVERPLVLGHEASGVVVALGDGATMHTVGERVCLEPGIPCGACGECRAGRYNLCAEVRFLATPPVDGAFTEYLCMHEDFVFTVPEHLSDDEAAQIEPLSVGVWACRKGDVRPGKRVLVTGAGPIGMLAMQVARASGAEVTISDIDPHRLAVAERLGADQVLDARSERPKAASADVLLECSGAGEAVRTGLEALKAAGRAVLVGMGADETLISVTALQTRELTLTGTFRYANTYPAAISLAASGKVLFEGITGPHFRLEDAGDALSRSPRAGEGLKAMVVVSSEGGG
jgi:L-iditol 2-dehydrogenase